MPSDNLIFIVTKNGKPLTKESFGNWFHECCIEAGLRRRLLMPQVALRVSPLTASARGWQSV